MNLNEFKLYLPKYLSSNSEKELFDNLKEFPNNIDTRFYTDFLQNENVIFQGDCIREMIVLNLPDTKTISANCLIISNTCDIDENNKRPFNSQITYAPIFNLDKYRDTIISNTKRTVNQVDSHINSIKRQEITQILYLPELTNVFEESIVFFDRLINCPNSLIDRKKLKTQRIFTLSDYGFYVFLIKLSIHFTRVQEKVERRGFKV